MPELTLAELVERYGSLREVYLCWFQGELKREEMWCVEWHGNLKMAAKIGLAEEMRLTRLGDKEDGT